MTAGQNTTRSSAAVFAVALRAVFAHCTQQGAPVFNRIPCFYQHFLNINTFSRHQGQTDGDGEMKYLCCFLSFNHHHWCEQTHAGHLSLLNFIFIVWSVLEIYEIYRIRFTAVSVQFIKGMAGYCGIIKETSGSSWLCWDLLIRKALWKGFSVKNRHVGQDKW